MGPSLLEEREVWQITGQEGDYRPTFEVRDGTGESNQPGLERHKG